MARPEFISGFLVQSIQVYSQVLTAIPLFIRQAILWAWKQL